MVLMTIAQLRRLFTSGFGKQDLSYILTQAQPQRSLADRLDWIELWMAWMRAPLPMGEQREQGPLVRVKFFMQLLERHPEWQTSVAQLWAGLWRDLRSFYLFAYMGLVEEKGFADQIADVLVEVFLPMSRDMNDLSEMLLRIFPEEIDAEWVQRLPAATMLEIKSLIESGAPEGPAIWKGTLKDLIDAMQVLATQIAGIGTSASLWIRLGSPRPSALSFVRLLDLVNQFVTHLRDEPELGAGQTAALVKIRAELELCSQSMEQAFAYLEHNGVNMGLIFRLEHQRLLIRRLIFLVEFLGAVSTGTWVEGLRALLVELIRASHTNKNLAAILRENLQRLALRVVEHTGSSGEHYITRTRSEYGQMLLSAAGGGIMTVGTTVLKFLISQAKAPFFIEAFGHFLNYAGSFLLMQGAHFTLATKQPSMTAPALAKKLSLGQGSSKGLALAYEIRHIVRSQLAAACGNVGLAVLTALLLAWGMQRSSGHPLFPADYSVYAVESLNPFKTLTVFYAALTGVLLWVSSLMAGWVENWMAFQQIPLRLIRNRPLQRVFGPHAGRTCADFLHKNISGIAGNISLGFFLAFVPFLGRIMGLPLDVRHVTLSSAQVAISTFSAWDKISPSMIGWAALGIVYTGLLNFGVSFWLALNVATRAQRVRSHVKKAVGRRFLQLLREQPLSFIFPTRRSEEEGFNELIAASSATQVKERDAR